MKIAYKIYFLRNFLIPKLRNFELQSCTAPKLHSCAKITKLRRTTSKLFSISSWISSFKIAVTSTPIKFICSCISDVFFVSSAHFPRCSFSAKLTRLGFVLLYGAFSLAGVFSVFSFILIWLSFDFQNFYMIHIYCCLHLKAFYSLKID